MRRPGARALDDKTLEAVRVGAVEAVQRGQRPETVAETRGDVPGNRLGLVDGYRAAGWDAMRTRPAPGRPAKITGLPMEWIYRTIEGKTPLLYRFEVALWTLDLVRWLIGERFAIRLSKTSTWRLMKQMRLSVQVPL